MRRGVGLVLTAVVGLTLCACTPSDEPAGTEPPSSPATPMSTTKPTDSGSSGESPTSLEAVVTVASVDVDGLHVTAAGYVGGVIEEGGECRFLFESGALSAEAESLGRADRSTTSCGSVSVARDLLERGPASVTLTYRSLDGREIASEPVGLEIP